MEEKRKSKRLPVHLFLDISSLFKQDNVKVENVDATFEVVDVSKHGIGFISKSTLPENYYFNAKLQLGHAKSCLHCVIRILRCIPQEDGYTRYGCEFVGMASIFDYVFDEYEAEISK